MAFKITDVLNNNSKAGMDKSPKASFPTKDISIFKMYRNEANFYDVNDIEDLASKILISGLMQNLSIVYDPTEKGEYRIIGGERRWEALKLLVSKGYKDFEFATCQIRAQTNQQEEEIELIISNSHRVKSTKETLEEAQRLKENLEYLRDNNISIKGYDLNSGRLRDIVASMLQTNKTKIGQIDNINKNLIPEFLEETKKERISFSAADKIAGMPEEEQKQLLEKYRETGELTYTEVKELKESKEEPEESEPDEPEETEEDETEEEEQNTPPSFEADPTRISSPCYTCGIQRYCDQKGSDVSSCPDYVNKSKPEPKQDNPTKESEKRTPIEQNNHSEPKEQPEAKRVHDIKCAAMYFEDAKNGIKPFELRKNDRDYKVGDTLHQMEYTEGAYTGRDIYQEVIFILEDYTGLTEGYCILGVKLI